MSRYISRYDLIMLGMLLWALIDFAGVQAEPPAETHISAVVCNYFSDECSNALRIIECESQFNQFAFNGFDNGIFQLNEYWQREAMGEERWANRFDLNVNTSWAYSLWSEFGWRLWACRVVL